MDQNSEIATINSPVTFPHPIPADRLKLIGLRLKKGANVAMSFNDSGSGNPTIVLSRRKDAETIDFDECAGWNNLPPVMISGTVFTEIVEEFSAEKAVSCLLANILSALGTVTFGLLFEEDGNETNKVVVSIEAGGFKTASMIDLADIIEFVGETGAILAPLADVPPQKPVPYDPCRNCAELLTGVGGAPCVDCPHKKS